MTRQLLAVLMAFLLLFPSCGFAQRLGPVETYADLVLLADQAEEGDTVLVSGRLQADETNPLTSQATVNITSATGQHAVVAGLHLHDARITFSDIDLNDSLTIDGTSHVMLISNVNVTGNAQTAVEFSGNGEFIINPSCIITAAAGGDGISIQHKGGNLYVALEGTVTGGDASNGGVGLVVSPLQSEGLLLIGGNISGGDGTDMGGNAVNLFDISGNAYISVIGNIKGGNGHIGGDGLQIISPQDTSNIGVLGYVEGGSGNEYGGNALFVLNASDQSTIALSGSLIGGNTVAVPSEPGQSLLLVGNGAINHMYSTGCLLEDGQILESVPTLSDTALADASSDAEGLESADSFPQVVAAAESPSDAENVTNDAAVAGEPEFLASSEPNDQAPDDTGDQKPAPDDKAQRPLDRPSSEAPEFSDQTGREPASEDQANSDNDSSSVSDSDTDDTQAPPEPEDQPEETSDSPDEAAQESTGETDNSLLVNDEANDEEEQ